MAKFLNNYAHFSCYACNCNVHVYNSLIAGDIHVRMFELLMKSVMCDNKQEVLDNTATAFLASRIYSIL